MPHAGYRRRTFTVTGVDGARIAVHAHDRPPTAALGTVVLTNGIGTSENFWRFLVESLRAEFEVVHWDYRGHGQSEESRDGDYSLPRHADDLARVVDAIAPRGRLFHIGFSMGVPVLLEHHRKHAETVAALVLVAGAADSPWSGVGVFRSRAARNMVSETMRVATPWVPRLAPLVHHALGSRFAYSTGRALGLLRRRAARDDVNELLQALQAINPLAYWSTLRALFSAQTSDVLSALRVPVFVAAAQNDVFIPREQVEAMHRSIPGAHFLLLEDAGHAAMLEAGPELATAVRAFLLELVQR